MFQIEDFKNISKYLREKKLHTAVRLIFLYFQFNDSTIKKYFDPYE